MTKKERKTERRKTIAKINFRLQNTQKLVIRDNDRDREEEADRVRTEKRHLKNAYDMYNTVHNAHNNKNIC